MADPAALALPVLLAAAGSADVGLRREALHALIVHDPAPAGGAYGPRGRWDPSEYVQRRTVDALVTRVDEPEARALLAEVYGSPGVPAWTRGYAALATLRAVPAADRPAVGAEIARLAAEEPRDGKAAGLLVAAAHAGDAASLARLGPWVAAGNLPLERDLILGMSAWTFPSARASPARSPRSAPRWPRRGSARRRATPRPRSGPTCAGRTRTWRWTP